MNKGLPVPDEDNGPSIDSENQEERLAARRIRIQRRAETQRREQKGDQPGDLQDMKETQSMSRQQMEESYLRLKKLQDDGFEMVTNIRVAGDAREVGRRVQDDESKRLRKEKLDAEEKTAIQRFDDITKKWETGSKKEIPQDLHDMLMAQKTACNLMLDEKNKVINDYQMDLKAKDDQYVQNLKKQAEEIDLLIERMDEQARELTIAYRTELQEIERAFVAERTTLLTKYRAWWDAMMDERTQKEIDYMAMRELRVADYEAQLKAARIQDAEEYTQLKIKLETDVQILQQQLQQMKATYQLNQEKLEYNFQVLRKRDEENAITKSQQKRRITRANDLLTNLKKKLAQQEKLLFSDNLLYGNDFKRMTEQFRDLQKKSKLFLNIDSKRFMDIWEMNEEECKTLANRLVEADRIIHEQQLGLDFEPPERVFMKNVGPLKSKTGKSAMELVSRIVTSDEQFEEATFGDGGGREFREVFPSTRRERDLEQLEAERIEEQKRQEEERVRNAKEQAALLAKAFLSEFTPQLVRQILELLCDESGFLIESKLHTLLAPLNKCEQTLMKLDVIFDLLGVETEEDIKAMTKYFVKVRKSKPGDSVYNSIGVGPDLIADIKDSTEKVEEIPVRESMDDSAVPDWSVARQRRVSAVQNDQSVSKVKAGEEVAAVSEDEDDELIEETQEVVDTNDVLKALRRFVEDLGNARARDKQLNDAMRAIGTMNDRDSSNDREYWEQYPGVISEDKEKMWDALIESFDSYYQVLGERSKLIDETETMRQQNTELRTLLHQYINSKINHELEVPPTRMIQLHVHSAV